MGWWLRNATLKATHLTQAEIYDPATQTSSRTGDMTAARESPSRPFSQMVKC